MSEVLGIRLALAPATSLVVLLVGIVDAVALLAVGVLADAGVVELLPPIKPAMELAMELAEVLSELPLLPMKLENKLARELALVLPNAGAAELLSALLPVEVVLAPIVLENRLANGLLVGLTSPTRGRRCDTRQAEQGSERALREQGGEIAA